MNVRVAGGREGGRGAQSGSQGTSGVGECSSQNPHYSR